MTLGDHGYLFWLSVMYHGAFVGAEGLEPTNLTDVNRIPVWLTVGIYGGGFGCPGWREGEGIREGFRFRRVKVLAWGDVELPASAGYDFDEEDAAIEDDFAGVVSDFVYNQVDVG